MTRRRGRWKKVGWRRRQRVGVSSAGRTNFVAASSASCVLRFGRRNVESAAGAGLVRRASETRCAGYAAPDALVSFLRALYCLSFTSYHTTSRCRSAHLPSATRKSARPRCGSRESPRRSTSCACACAQARARPPLRARLLSCGAGAGCLATKRVEPLARGQRALVQKSSESK